MACVCGNSEPWIGGLTWFEVLRPTRRALHYLQASAEASYQIERPRGRVWRFEFRCPHERCRALDSIRVWGDGAWGRSCDLDL